jgi:hypothetical protein
MKYFLVILQFLGASFLAIILHEIYHFLTKNVSDVCLAFKNGGIMYVKGVGDSSEIIAYIITFLTIFIISIIIFRSNHGHK